ncbi:short-chain dehydrogenase [Dactylosporangium sucinum]|uniref:Short-chain dehydrogenase n=2 Tax=Dactylosporangium sucinum TaxID=1424081 RepID=A0A917TIG9_9ACTN|nr:short-chain dehydrogenase [Dactylosporangium sucinum]
MITGANSGIGLATAKLLARQGATVILACRDPHAMRDAADQVMVAAGDASRVDQVVLDLAELSSVDATAATIGGRYPRLDILVNNAGVMAPKRQRLTRDGFEEQMGVNHLGHFALTGRLLPLLVAGEGARIVTLSSKTHAAVMDVEADIPVPRRYRPWAAYGASKLANLLFAFELHRRLVAAGHAAVSVACHPGFTSTRLTREMASSRVGVALLALVQRLLTQPAADGALPAVCAAAHPAITGGEYLGPVRLAHTRGPAGLDRPRQVAADRELAARLWERSEALTGVVYRFVQRLQPSD